jgi:hypothetical protein
VLDAWRYADEAEGERLRKREAQLRGDCDAQRKDLERVRAAQNNSREWGASRLSNSPRRSSSSTSMRGEQAYLVGFLKREERRE